MDCCPACGTYDHAYCMAMPYGWVKITHYDGSEETYHEINGYERQVKAIEPPVAVPTSGAEIDHIVFKGEHNAMVNTAKFDVDNAWRATRIAAGDPER